MKLKGKYGTREEIPAGYEDLYTEKNGEWEFTGVEGLKTQADVTRVQEALTKERAAHKSTKEAFKALDGLDVAEVVAQLDRIPELEAQVAAGGGADPAKIDALVETRIKARVAPLERERDTLKGQVVELGGKVEQFETQSKTRSVHDAVRAEATKLGIIPSALDDALMLAERALGVSEDGAIVVNAGAGFTEGLDVGTWLTEVREKRAHWWPASEGGGAGGGNATNGGGVNPFTNAGWNMTEQGRIYKENPAKAENMAKSAGTTVGGQRPAK